MYGSVFAIETFAASLGFAFGEFHLLFSVSLIVSRITSLCRIEVSLQDVPHSIFPRLNANKEN